MRTPEFRAVALLCGFMTTFSGAACWLLEQLGARDKFGIWLTLFLIVLAGTVLPSMVMLVLVAWKGSQFFGDQGVSESRIGLDGLERRLEAVEKSIAVFVSVAEPKALSSRDMSALKAGIEHDPREFILHLFDACYITVGYHATELRHERGPKFTKAKDEHLRAIDRLLETTNRRYILDRKYLLLIDPNDSLNLRTKYTEIKEEILRRCRNAQEALSARTLNNDEAHAKIKQAATELQVCTELIENGKAYLGNRH